VSTAASVPEKLLTQLIQLQAQMFDTSTITAQAA
jgi:hypothetical protein